MRRSETPIDLSTLAQKLKVIHPADIDETGKLLCTFVIQNYTNTEIPGYEELLLPLSDLARRHLLLLQQQPRRFEPVIRSHAELLGRFHDFSFVATEVFDGSDEDKKQAYDVHLEVDRIAGGLGVNVYDEDIDNHGYINAAGLNPIVKYLRQNNIEYAEITMRQIQAEKVGDESWWPAAAAANQAKPAFRISDYLPDVAIAIAAAVIAVIVFHDVNAWHSAPASTANRAWHFFAWGLCYILLVAAPVSIWIRHATRGEISQPHCSPAESSAR